ncbi:MAG: pilus assembly protein PilM [Patescibacteria group bacterium]
MSFQKRILAMFPPPSVIAMPAAGVDISSNSIKCVSLKSTALGLEVRTCEETPLQKDIVVEGEIEQPEKVIDVLRSYRLRHHVRNAMASIPEQKAYLYQALIPENVTNLRAGVESGLEAHVPLPPGEVLFDFEIVRRIQAGTIVSVTAYAKRMIEEYSSVFRSAGVILRAIEVESQALARSVLRAEDLSRTIMIIDLGRYSTRIAIADAGVVSFTASVDMGSEALTGVIMKKFSISGVDAEKMKNEKGFVMSTQNADLVETLMTTVSVMKDEIVKHFSYWNAPSADDVTRLPVEKVILSGGGTNLRGIAEYLETFLNVPVTIADVWTNAFPLDSYVPPMEFSESLEYATAIGLALRGNRQVLW